jgi:O-methyltransferase
MKEFLRALAVKTIPDSELARLISYLPKTRRFDFSNSKFFPKKQELYDYINAELIGNKPLSYLEFGVFKGASFKYWASINKNNDSEFVGFDTFTGLPEEWWNLSVTVRKNHFDTNGKTPEMNDARCRFVKGMFQDTLDDFLTTYHPKEKLVVHNDSDLYSSTLFTLTKLHPWLKPGSVVIFDEFSSVLHEMRALNDFAASYLFKYKIIGHTLNYRQVAITAV